MHYLSQCLSRKFSYLNETIFKNLFITFGFKKKLQKKKIAFVTDAIMCTIMSEVVVFPDKTNRRNEWFGKIKKKFFFTKNSCSFDCTRKDYTYDDV